MWRIQKNKEKLTQDKFKQDPHTLDTQDSIKFSKFSGLHSLTQGNFIRTPDELKEFDCIVKTQNILMVF